MGSSRSDHWRRVPSAGNEEAR